MSFKIVGMGKINMGEKLIELLTENGFKLSTLVLIIVIIIILTNIDKVLIIKSEFYGLFSKTWSFAKTKQVSKSVRGTILKSIKEQKIKDTEIFPSDLKVIWINEENPESFVNNNQVIVRIKQSSNPHENLVTAVSEYVSSGLLYNVKRYLNKEVLEASNVLMTRKIIQSANKSSLTYLDEQYIIPKLNQNADLKELYDDLVRIDNNGMFVGIMLNEFKKAGMSIYGQIEDPELIAESKEFMRFLYNIAIRLSNEETDLCFNRDYFKVAIFLTASNWTLRNYGITPFIKVAYEQLTNGIETIYVFGLGRKRQIAEQISKEIGNDFRVSYIKEHTYRHINSAGKRTPGIFYECAVYKENV